MDKDYNNKEVKSAEEDEDISLGSLLRRSREERRIDLDEAASVTRIRRNNLEALENEEWSKLPSRVFVKGFLRSYAEFLGLDKEMVLDSYRKVFPFQECKPEALKGIDLKSTRWYHITIILVLALAFALAIIYLKKSDISIIDKALQHIETQVPEEKKEDLSENKDDKIQEDIFLEGENEDTAEKKDEIVPKLDSAQATRILRELTVPQEEIYEEPLSPRYTLTANVNKQTWIAINIDDSSVKEYLFQPGNTVKWTAEKGFDILVGNAGGIEFFLNGNPVGNLGAEGQVVRVNLPK